MDYKPESWMIIKINGEDPHYRVLGSWFGGYTGLDTWRLNSGITKVEEDEDFYYFHGSSGSTYICYKSTYGGHTTARGVANRYVEKLGAEILEPQDWFEIDWIIKI